MCVCVCVCVCVYKLISPLVCLIPLQDFLGVIVYVLLEGFCFELFGVFCFIFGVDFHYSLLCFAILIQ